MKQVTVTVGSVTYAIKLKRLLMKEGIRADLVKVDNTDRNSGCSHGVRISERDFLSAVVILRESSIQYSILGQSDALP